MCLPLSNGSENSLRYQREKSKLIDLELLRDSIGFKNKIRILLLGPGESGKSTFLKQMKVLHKDGFSDEEKLRAIDIIKDNVHECIFTLVTNLRKHNIQLEQQMSIRSVDYILKMGEKRPSDIPPEYRTHIKLLWMDEGIRELYEKRNTFQLLDCAQYFLDKIDIIYGKSYIPSNDDILNARVVTKGVNESNFTVKKGKHSYGILMIDVGGQREERSKWVQAFAGVKVVLYLSACSEFDQQLRENDTENRFSESLKLFRTIWRNRYFIDTGMIVFLNKTDLLEEKLRKGKRIGRYFEDYVQFENEKCNKQPNTKNDPNDIEKTKAYIKYKFEQIAIPFTTRGLIKDEDFLVQRECTLHFTTATDTENVKKVFADCQHIILMQNLKKWELA